MSVASVRVLLQERNQSRGGFCGFFRLRGNSSRNRFILLTDNSFNNFVFAHHLNVTYVNSRESCRWKSAVNDSQCPAIKKTQAAAAQFGKIDYYSSTTQLITKGAICSATHKLTSHANYVLKRGSNRWLPDHRWQFPQGYFINVCFLLPARKQLT